MVRRDEPRGRRGKRLSPDWARIFARLSLDHPNIDWLDTPLDRVQFLIEEITAGEERATLRAWMTFREVGLSDALKLGRPDWMDKDAPSGGTAPYPVPPTVARGILRAVTLGLITGPALASWPAGTEGESLSRILDRLEARA